MLVARVTASCLTCALPPRRPRIGALIFLKLKGMGSEVRLSNISTSVSPPQSRHKNKELNECVDYARPSEKCIIKEDIEDNYVEIETIRDDLSRLDTMTVKELRTMTRSAGIPAKGRKQDLVSALKCFLLKSQDASAGRSSQLGGEVMRSAVQPNNMPSKRNRKSSSFEENAQDISAVSEVFENVYKRNRRKQQSLKSARLEDDSGTVVVKQKLTVKTEEVLETKRSRLSKKVSSQIENDNKMNLDEPWTVLAHKKPQHGWIPYNPNMMRPPPLAGDTRFVKLMSWNVNGLRALLKLESFSALELAQRENFDVLCLQETKIQEKDVEVIKERLIEGYENSFWTCSVSKLGYSGTAIISRIKPISVKYGLGIPDHDSEGRLVTVEFETFYLLCAYVPNSGDGLKRLTYRVKQWDSSLSNYMKDLEKSKPVILTGDLNCAHQEIDIYNPAGNRRSAGFTDEERESFEMSFLSRGFVDTFRKQHPGVVGYTYWGYRHGGRRDNKGWRLDYFLVSESIADKAYDSYILPDVAGSDHCPIGLILKL